MSRRLELLPPDATHPFEAPLSVLPGFDPARAFNEDALDTVPRQGNLIKASVRPDGDFSLAVHPYADGELTLEEHDACVRARMPRTLDPFILVGSSYITGQFDTLRTTTVNLHDGRKLVAENPTERTLSVTTDVSSVPLAKELIVSRIIPPGFDTMRMSLSGLARTLRMRRLDDGALYMTAYQQVRSFWSDPAIGGYLAASHMPRLGAILGAEHAD